MMKLAVLFLIGAPGASAFSSSVNRSAGGSTRVSTSQLCAAAKSLEAILFDCDGVLADTERDGHRISFNIAFQENGIDESWDESRYGKLLEVGGGKERMTAHWVSLNCACSTHDVCSKNYVLTYILYNPIIILYTAFFVRMTSAGQKKFLKKAVPIKSCHSIYKRQICSCN